MYTFTSESIAKIFKDLWGETPKDLSIKMHEMWVSIAAESDKSLKELSQILYRSKNKIDKDNNFGEYNYIRHMMLKATLIIFLVHDLTHPICITLDEGWEAAQELVPAHMLTELNKKK